MPPASLSPTAAAKVAAAANAAAVTAKIGLYGKGTYNVTRARADLQKAAEHVAKNFSRTKAYNCTIQPKKK